jgi:hypothetical protein
MHIHTGERSDPAAGVPMNTPQFAPAHLVPLDDYAREPDRLDWDTARRIRARPQ